MSKRSYALDTALDFVTLTGGGSINSYVSGVCEIHKQGVPYWIRLVSNGSDLECTLRAFDGTGSVRYSLELRRKSTLDMAKKMISHMHLNADTTVYNYFGKMASRLAFLLERRDIIVTYVERKDSLGLILTSSKQGGNESINVNLANATVTISLYKSSTEVNKHVTTIPNSVDLDTSILMTLESIRVLL